MHAYRWTKGEDATTMRAVRRFVLRASWSRFRDSSLSLFLIYSILNNTIGGDVWSMDILGASLCRPFSYDKQPGMYAQ